MNRTAKKPRPYRLLWPMTCVLAISGCAASGQAVRQPVCPILPPPPSNVMRSPQAESSLRALLFESDGTRTTSYEPAKQSSGQTGSE